MQRRTTCTTLRKTLDLVSDLPVSVLIHDGQAMKPVDPICAISRQVEARLWSMLQRTLFDRLAASRLKPLTVPHSGSSFDPTLSGGMLEDLLVSSCETELGTLTGIEDDDLLFSDAIDGEEDDLLSSDGMDGAVAVDAVDVAEIADDDDLLDDYQDEEHANERVELEGAESLDETRDIERRFERIDNMVTSQLCEEREDSLQDWAIVHYIDSESCNTFEGRECDRELWRRDVDYRNEAPSEFEPCFRPAHGSTLDEDEMII